MQSSQYNMNVIRYATQPFGIGTPVQRCPWATFMVPSSISSTTSVETTRSSLGVPEKQKQLRQRHYTMSAQPTSIPLTFVSKVLVGRIHSTCHFSVSDNVDGVDGNEILTRVGNVAARRHFQENVSRHGIPGRTNVAKVILVILVLSLVCQNV